MTEVQRWVEQVRHEWAREAERAGVTDWRELSSGILLHIAASCPKPRFVATAPQTPGEVRFSVEVVPYHPGANGEEYHSGTATAEDAARALREASDRCRYWTADKVERPYDPDAPRDVAAEQRAKAAKRAAHDKAI